MSTLTDLKDYLLGKDRDVGYLLKDENNGKTVMLSGAWGSGKTHFWQNEIEIVQKKIKIGSEETNKYFDEEYESGLSYKLNEKKKSSVYISLYGKDSLSELKKEVLFRASTEKDYLSEEIEAFGFDALSTIDEVGGAIGAIYKVASSINESRKDKKGENKLRDGGVICFDDFERKSKNIDLNDLFGFISQLAINLNCKVVIILNSDVFEDEEANVFKTVKEKTVNKFFYLKPSSEELFESIYNSDVKYIRLNEYRNEILSTIKETEELNARIYIQVLDNCFEWIDKGYDNKVLRTLVLNTVCFIKHHFILDYPVLMEVREPNTDDMNEVVAYNELRVSSDISHYIIRKFPKKDLNSKILIENKINEFYDHIVSHFSNVAMPDEERKIILDEIDESYDFYMTIIKFGYKMYVAKDIEKGIYEQISNFIKTGILLKNDEESSS